MLAPSVKGRDVLVAVDHVVAAVAVALMFAASLLLLLVSGAVFALTAVFECLLLLQLFRRAAMMW